MKVGRYPTKRGRGGEDTDIHVRGRQKGHYWGESYDQQERVKREGREVKEGNY